MDFFRNNLDIVFFIYGLAFLAMGIAILVQPKKDSGFKLAEILWLLAFFGVIHGLNEVLDMWAIIKGRHPVLDIIRWFVLVVSYIFLFEFGRKLFCLTGENSRPYQKKIARLLSWKIIPAISAAIFVASYVSADFWRTGNIWTRYFIGFPGSLLVGFGLNLYYRNAVEVLEPLRVKKYFLLGGISFLVYGTLGGLIVPKGSFFPSNFINTDSFLLAVKIPVQAFRAACAVCAAWSMTGILKVFNYEAREKLQKARQQLEVQLEKNIKLTKNLSSLFDISKDILTEFNTKVLLKKIADDACKLIGCRYSAIGILHDEGGYEYFVSSGIADEVIEDITRKHGMPSGKGLPEYLLWTGIPLRTDDISKHSASEGFPEGHPEMKTFLGVPVVLHNKHIGGLYFAEKLKGEKFSEEDERLAASFTAVVALAVNNILMLKEIENLASFPQNSPYPVVECDINGNITYLNPSARSLIHVLGLKGRDILPPDIHETAINSEKSNKEFSYHEVNFCGMVFAEYCHFVPDKKSVRVYIYNITDQKLAESEIKRNYMMQKALDSLLNLSLKDISLNELLNCSLDIILSIPFLPFKKGGIFIVEKEPDMLVLATNRHLPLPVLKSCSRVPFGKCLCGKAASTGIMQFCNSIDERHENAYDGMSPHGHYNIPVLSKGKVIGVIVLYLEEMHWQEKGEVEFLKTIADTLAGAVERRNAERMLKDSYRQLRRLTEHLQAVREEERGKVAREIHDELGQLMTALMIDLKWLGGRFHRVDGLLVDKAKSMIGIVETGIEAIQRISSELRPRMLDDLGLSAAIDWQAKEFHKKTGIECMVNIIPEEIILNKEIATNIFRIFQEAITNVVRHADATMVTVNLKVDSSDVELVITDNGKGISDEQISSPYSFGLASMQERVLPWDGIVVISGEKDKGTTVKVTIPNQNGGHHD